MDAELKRGVISIAASAFGKKAKANQTTANANKVNSKMCPAALFTDLLRDRWTRNA